MRLPYVALPESPDDANAARVRSCIQKSRRNGAGISPFGTLRNVFALTSASSRQLVLSEDSTVDLTSDKVRRAVQTIERCYLAHAHVVPNALDTVATKADWGTLCFPGKTGGESRRAPAHYIRVPERASSSRTARIIAKFWKVPRPSLLIAVAGGASSLDLPPRIEQAFRHGLLNIALSTQTLILTGGMSNGVMSLVGSAFEDSPVPPPIIGFASWTKVLGHATLRRNRGEEQPRPYFAGMANSEDGAGLEYHHSHFVLIDCGANSRWGAEIALRDSIQEAYAEVYSIPSVLLVVQGGVGTLRTVHKAMCLEKHGDRGVERTPTPVVLLAGSGGAADVISRYSDGWSSARGASSLDLRTYEGGRWASHEEMLRQIVLADEKHWLLNLFHSRPGRREHMDDVILRAILRKQLRWETSAQQLAKWTDGHAPVGGYDEAVRTPGSIALEIKFSTDRSVRLAVLWGRADLLRQLLKDREEEMLKLASRGPRKGGDLQLAKQLQQERAEELQRALQLALEQDRPEICILLMQSGASMTKANLLLLYCKDSPDNLGLYSHNELIKELRRVLNHALRERRRARKPRLEPHEEAHLFQEFVQPFLCRILPAFSGYFHNRAAIQQLGRESARRTGVQPPPSSTYIRMSDFFFWAVASGRWDLSLALWRQTSHPVRCGLLASGMCKQMAGRHETHRERLMSMAQAFESRATDILDELPAGEPSYLFLCGRGAFWPQSLVELAWENEMKRFMSHPLCRMLIKRLSSSTDRLSLMSLTSSVSIFLSVLRLVPLDGCVDVMQERWKLRKRQLTLSEQRRSKPTPLVGFARYIEFLQIPRVKLLLRNIFSCLYLLLFVLYFFTQTEVPSPCLWQPMTSFIVIRHTFSIWTVAILLDEMLQMKRDGIRAYFCSYWNLLDMLWLGMVVGSILLSSFEPDCEAIDAPELRAAPARAPSPCDVGRVDEAVEADEGVEVDAGPAISVSWFNAFTLKHSPTSTWELSVILLGYAAIPLFLRLLAVFGGHRKLGVLLIIVTNMVQDVMLFLTISGSTFLGFGLAFVAILRIQGNYKPLLVSGDAFDAHWLASQLDGNEVSRTSLRISLSIPLWVIVGENHMELIDSVSPTMGAVVLWIYILLAQVLLVNLLIAMMGSTYTRYSRNAEQEFFFNQLRVLMDARTLFSIPPPISLPLLPFALLGILKQTDTPDEDIRNKMREDDRVTENLKRGMLSKVHRSPEEEDKTTETQLDQLLAKMLTISEQQEEEAEHRRELSCKVDRLEKHFGHSLPGLQPDCVRRSPASTSPMPPDRSGDLLAPVEESVSPPFFDAEGSPQARTPRPGTARQSYHMDQLAQQLIHEQQMAASSQTWEGMLRARKPACPRPVDNRPGEAAVDHSSLGSSRRADGAGDHLAPVSFSCAARMTARTPAGVTRFRRECASEIVQMPTGSGSLSSREHPAQATPRRLRDCHEPLEVERLSSLAMRPRSRPHARGPFSSNEGMAAPPRLLKPYRAMEHPSA
ncbi:hypothetical protein AB1Y20_021774 [Prymnesium parvum]|uniref:Uncharacterized protein n=1 Tax=Prymnesium parvum TaxID=97485 RepID=A0AB34JM68_PRYPA